MAVFSLPEPSASWTPERLADWVELSALVQADRNASLVELARALHRGGTTDVAPLGKDTRRQERCLQVAEGAFSALDERATRCGHYGDGYPFEIQDGWLQFSGPRASPLYVFLLLLTKFGKDAVAVARADKANRPEKIFEDICAVAAHEFLAPEDDLSGFCVVGAPRTTMPKPFHDAATQLCRALGEGVGANRDAPRLSAKKDAGLDLAAWRGFPDRKPSQLIGFGQCATGDDWRTKLGELRPGEWWTNWIMQVPGLFPVGLFFLPRSLDSDDWWESCAGTRLMFDRGRIVAQVNSDLMPVELKRRYRRWNRAVLTERMAT